MQCKTARVTKELCAAGVVYESAAIVAFLDDAFPQTPRLLPNERAARLEARLWQYWELCIAEEFWPLSRMQAATAKSDAAGALLGVSCGRPWASPSWLVTRQYQQQGKAVAALSHTVALTMAPRALRSMASCGGGATPLKSSRRRPR